MNLTEILNPHHNPAKTTPGKLLKLYSPFYDKLSTTELLVINMCIYTETRRRARAFARLVLEIQKFALHCILT